MTNFLGRAKTQAASVTAYGGVQLQTSSYGKAIPLVYGANRIAPNLLWYGNFIATPQASAGQAGKGGGTSGGGKGGSPGSYSYQTALILGVCEGPVAGFGAVYIDKNVTSLGTMGLSAFLGAYPQAPWGFLSARTQTTSEAHVVPVAPPYQVTVGQATGGGAQGFAYDAGVTGVAGTQSVTLKASTDVTGAPPPPGYYSATASKSGSVAYVFHALSAGQQVIIRCADVRGAIFSWSGVVPAAAPHQLAFYNSAYARTLDVTMVQVVNQVLSRVSGSVGTGQYIVEGGVYSFSAAQAGQQVTLGYVTAMSVLNAQALSYNGVAYLANGAYQLGTSAQLPNHNVEVMGFYAGSAPSAADADPSLVVAHLLGDPHVGAGFPASRIGDFTRYRSYCLAAGLWVSPAYTEQTQSASMLDEMARLTNSAFVWSDGVLQLVPYGDSALSANGYSYTPAAVLYDLTDDDFMARDGAGDPVQLTRTRASDAYNAVKLECKDRNNQYNAALVEAQDQASIDQYGLRAESATPAQIFCDMTAARIAAQLRLQRYAVRNLYQFRLDQRYILLDPMDIVTLTDARLGLARQAVRITEITENDDGTLDMSAEEYLDGSATAASYGFERGGGYQGNYNAPASATSAPVIFEPTAFLAQGLQVWLGLCGSGNWGGADIWLSNDGETYKNIGRVTTPARLGVLTAGLPICATAVTGQTIDEASSLALDLRASGNHQLLSTSQDDATSLASLCYVDGELLSYQTAELTGEGQYLLHYLVRGAYGSVVAAHAAGSAFLRLDDAVFSFAFTPDKIGASVFLKFLSFNVHGGGGQALSDVTPYIYHVQGTAYGSPLPNVTHLRSSYVANITQLVWDEVSDFRPVQYEIRKGTNWAGGQVLGRVAHPPFNAQGNDTYWVAAYSQPVPALSVYSAVPAPIVISGAQIVSNVIARWDEAATGWSGALTGNSVQIGAQLVTSGSGNVLGIANYLATASVLSASGTGTGCYTILASHVIQIGRAAPCTVLLSWLAYGQHITDTVFNVSDYLGDPDVLDYGASSSIDVAPEIAISPDGASWGAWQKYAAGAYVGAAFKARITMTTLDPSVLAYLSRFSFAVDVPDRDDHYVNLAVSAAGASLVFTPDGASASAAFNGGPQGSALLPAVQATILNASSGDTAVISGLSLSGCSLQILNGGMGVARNVNVLVEGY